MNLDEQIKIAEKQVFYTEQEIYQLRVRHGRHAEIPPDLLDKLIEEYHFLIELLKGKK